MTLVIKVLCTSSGGHGRTRNADLSTAILESFHLPLLLFGSIMQAKLMWETSTDNNESVLAQLTGSCRTKSIIAIPLQPWCSPHCGAIVHGRSHSPAIDEACFNLRLLCQWMHKLRVMPKEVWEKEEGEQLRGLWRLQTRWPPWWLMAGMANLLCCSSSKRWLSTSKTMMEPWLGLPLNYRPSPRSFTASQDPEVSGGPWIYSQI